jgi:hypothetical protein
MDWLRDFLTSNPSIGGPIWLLVGFVSAIFEGLRTVLFGWWS